MPGYQKKAARGFETFMMRFNRKLVRRVTYQLMAERLSQKRHKSTPPITNNTKNLSTNGCVIVKRPFFLGQLIFG
jgi:hypothetical protein